MVQLYIPVLLDGLIQRSVIVCPAVSFTQVVVSGDTGVTAAFQFEIVNETLGHSRVHDVVGIIQRK